MPLLQYRRPQVGLLFQKADYDALATASKKPLEKQRVTLQTLHRLRAVLNFSVQQQVLSNSIHLLFLILTLSLSSLLLSQTLVKITLIKFYLKLLSTLESTYCFVDLKFVDTYHLKTSITPLVALHLFNELSNNTISEIANLPIIFPTGDCITLDFYVTSLDSSCSLVLGYNQLI